MKSLLLAALVVAGVFIDTPPDAPPESYDFMPHHASPTPSPSPSDAIEDTPYEPALVKQAVRHLMVFKGMNEEQYRADPNSLISDKQDVGRFLAYLAVLTYLEGHTIWAIQHYCQAITVDPRYMGLDDIPPDTEKTFLTGLQVIRLEALKYLADRISRNLKLLPSRVYASPSPQAE